MGRAKKNPDYDADRVFKEYVDSVVAFYLADGTLEQNVSLRSVADEFDTTILKIRKVLITAGVFQSETGEQVQLLYEEGKTIPEIQKELRLSRASVYSYLPYVKTIYNANEVSANAERLKNYRKRRKAVNGFKSSLSDGCPSEDIIWKTVSAFVGYPFYTCKGMKFYYTVHGNEMLVDRKKKTITRSTVHLFVQRVLSLQSEGKCVTGPKKVGTFGASYLFPIFKRFGLIL